MEKKINYLIGYAVISTLVFGVIIFSSFSKINNQDNFDEINVKRINIVAEDGSLRMVLSNDFRQHPGRINGVDLEKRDRPAGILFFNTEGDECGGITYYGNTENGETQSGMSFTMDQYKEDQVIQILNGENIKEGKYRIIRGISISDLPEGSDLITRMNQINEIKKELEGMTNEEERNKRIAEIGNSLGSKQRLFVGRNKHNNAGLFLSGPDGKQKMKIYVDDNGNPNFEVIDENGNSKNLLENK